MPNYVILRKEELLVTVACERKYTQAELQSLTEQGFSICSQVIEADSTKEALFYFENDPQLYAIDQGSSAAVDGVLAVLMSLGVRAM